MTTTENRIERDLISKLEELKYTYRSDIRDREALENNFREKFEALNRVRLADAEFQRLLEQIITPDVFAAAGILREFNSFERDDGTPLNYMLVNIRDWCKNSFEVVNQLRINTDNSHHRYDVMLLINGVPVVQVELKTLAISPPRAMQQIVDYKNDPGNGYGKTLLCFIQLFIVSNRTDTWYFATNRLGMDRKQSRDAGQSVFLWILKLTHYLCLQSVATHGNSDSAAHAASCASMISMNTRCMSVRVFAPAILASCSG